jgi:endo-1,3-1,4-beta-glycanase ExoK
MLRRLLVPIALSALTFAVNAGAVTGAELYRTAGEGPGKFEARVRFAAGDGIISSFFLWKDGSEKSTVFWNELDFEKMGATCQLQTNSIYGLPQSNHEQLPDGLATLCDEYHTYSYEWTPDYIAWAVDGVEVRRETGAAAAAYSENASDGLQMRFNVWPGDASFGGTFDEANLPVYQYVDWAQYASYTPGTGDNGTDFTLSWREDFDGKPKGWAMATWDSPLGLSTHSPENVTFVDGIAVIALTADDAKGYSGIPPQDPAGGGGEDGAGATSTTPTGQTPASGVDTTSPVVDTPPPAVDTPRSSKEADGCSFSPAPHSFGQGSLGVLALVALGGLVRSPLRAHVRRAL